MILGILVGVMLVRRARVHLVQALGVAMIAGAVWLLARSHLPGDIPAESAAGPEAGGSASGSVFFVASLLIPAAAAVAGFLLSSRIDRG